MASRYDVGQLYDADQLYDDPYWDVTGGGSIGLVGGGLFEEDVVYEKTGAGVIGLVGGGQVLVEVPVPELAVQAGTDWAAVIVVTH